MRGWSTVTATYDAVAMQTHLCWPRCLPCSHAWPWALSEQTWRPYTTGCGAFQQTVAVCMLFQSQLTSSVWGCSRASIDEFMGDLAVRWPGVTHRVTLDAHQTAEHLLYTTLALAKQPSTDQVRPGAQNLSRRCLCARDTPC